MGIFRRKRNLSIKEKKEKLDEQGGRCSVCGGSLDMDHAECHHEVKFSEGGPSTKFNTSMVHEDCHDDLTEEQRGDDFGRKDHFGADREKKLRKSFDEFYNDDE